MGRKKLTIEAHLSVRLVEGARVARSVVNERLDQQKLAFEDGAIVVIAE
jgi:hypothetical protein